MKRIFIGSFIKDNSLKKKYSLIKKEFGSCLKGRWTPYDNFHITYKFIGNVEDHQLLLIKQSLSSILNKEKEIHVIFKGFGVFPDINNPKVFYIKVENPDGKLQEINELIQNKLALIGYKKDERNFIPHITLKRPKSIKTDELAIKMKQFQEEIFGEVFKLEINVIQSILSPEGAKYIKI
ncbi:MAG: RNA 2',3'-cyclic phosphodiesterase [Aquificae bacterium]|nr:RNA 2',3'-cyclic phosphodiesterase [Aquificota bacterium]